MKKLPRLTEDEVRFLKEKSPEESADMLIQKYGERIAEKIADKIRENLNKIN
jgi:hypothetical protein